MPRWLCALGVALCVLAGSGCGTPEAPIDGSAGTDAQLRCTRDEECDDLVFCNGEEQCLPAATGADARGCLSRSMPRCADGQICDEVTEACITDCGVTEDADGDGRDAERCGGDDCDDSDPDRFPGNREVCDEDGHDEDCDESSIGARDQDGDRILDAVCCNTRADGTLNCGGDCDDSDPAVAPGAPERCDGRDDDCDMEIDEGALVAGFADRDGDLHGDPAMPLMACPGAARFSTEGDDCDDSDAADRVAVARVRHGAQPEICDSIDNDCDGAIDERAGAVAWYRDRDGDGFGSAASGVVSSCTPVAGHSLLATDCDDTLVTVSPVSAELCNGLDDNCNGVADFLVAAGDLEDDDGDGVADMRCPVVPVDCNDRDALTYPGAPELCDGRDNDCNGITDGSTTDALWYVDADHDAFGDDGIVPVMSCEPQTGRVPRAGDCDDADPAIRPGAPDGCAGVSGTDDDCDLDVDEDTADVALFTDRDGDGFGAGEPLLACGAIAGRVASAGDCDDLDPTRRPSAAELCDGASTTDVDCDGSVGCDDPDCAATTECRVVGSLVVSSGGGQTPQITREAVLPLVLELQGDMGAPLAGHAISVSATRGASAIAIGDAMTDASGRVSFRVRAGLRTGAFSITARAAGARPVTASFEALAAPVGWAIPAINADRTYAGAIASGALSPVSTHVGGVTGIAIASDSTTYVTDHWGSGVLRIDPDGVMTRIAGTGTYGVSGDGGPATLARLSYTTGLALDEDAALLYVADHDNERIRVIDLASGRIDTFAGGGSASGPTYGDGGPATSADIGRPRSIALAPDGSLWLSSHSRIRRVDAAGVIRGVLTGEATAACAERPLVFIACHASDGCPMVFAPDGALFFAGTFCGTELDSQVEAIVRRAPDGALALVVGAPAATGGDTDGVAGDATYLPTRISALALDPAGNLYYATQHVVRRVDAALRTVHTVLGGAAAGASGDYGDATRASTNEPFALAFDPNGGALWVAEYGTYSARIVVGAARTTAPVATLSIATGATQSAVYAALAGEPLGARLVDGTGAVVRGVRVRFRVAASSSAPEAIALGATLPRTSLTGVASIAARVGLSSGAARIEASFRTIHETEVMGSPVSFRIDVSAPASGVIVPVLGIDRMFGASSSGPSVTGRGYVISGLATGADGTIYYSSQYAHRLMAITREGALRVVAGTGASGTVGDGGRALDATLSYPALVALSPDGTRLYTFDASTVVRVVDLSTGIIDRYLGNGDSGAVLDGAQRLETPLSEAQSMIVSSDGALWIGQSTGVLRVDPTTGVVARVLSPEGYGNCSAGGAHIVGLTTGTQLAAGAGGSVLLTAYACEGDDSAFEAILRRASDGSLSILVGAYAGATTDGALARESAISGVGTLLEDPVRGLLWSQPGTNRVRYVDAGGRVRTLVGDGTGASTGDFGLASEASVYGPRALGVRHDGALLIAEENAYIIRAIY